MKITVQLTDEEVKDIVIDFLVAYYTKDLEANEASFTLLKHLTE